MEFSNEFKALVGDNKQHLSTENLSKMDFSSLLALRKAHKGDLEVQKAIAPFEHRAYAREAVASNGWMAPVLAIAAPAYQLAKHAGIDIGEEEDRAAMNTPPSGKQFVWGIEGVGQGLKELLGFKEEPSKQVSEGKIKQAPNEIDSIMDRLIQAESTNRHTDEGGLLTSPAGAKGVTQVMPHTGKNPGYGVSPLKNSTKEEYVRFAKDYLTAMKEKFGDMDKALAAYNAGPAKVTRAIIRAERKGKDWKTFLPKETQEYIKKVAIEDVNKGVV